MDSLNSIHALHSKLLVTDSTQVHIIHTYIHLLVLDHGVIVKLTPNLMLTSLLSPLWGHGW